MKLLRKILLTILPVILIVFVIILGINIMQSNRSAVNSATDHAQKLIQAEGLKYASELEGTFNYTLDITHTLGSNLKTMVEEGKGDRDLVNAMLKQILSENDNFLAVWTIWEPNVFDKMDNYYINKLGHDGTGRFIPTWSRDNNGTLKLNPLVGYDQEGEGDYYLLAKNSGKETILEPYYYEINGQEILMTTLTTPIKVNGKFVGAVGVDISLETLQKLNEAVKLFESGFGTIITGNETIIAHPNKKIVNTPLTESIKLKNIDKIQQAVQTGESVFIEDISMTLQELTYMYVSPIHIGLDETWSIVVVVPKKK